METYASDAVWIGASISVLRLKYPQHFMRIPRNCLWGTSKGALMGTLYLDFPWDNKWNDYT